MLKVGNNTKVKKERAYRYDGKPKRFHNPSKKMSESRHAKHERMELLRMEVVEKLNL